MEGLPGLELRPAERYRGGMWTFLFALALLFGLMAWLYSRTLTEEEAQAELDGYGAGDGPLESPHGTQG